MKCRQLAPRRLFVETLEQREYLTAITPVFNTTSYPARATVSISETFDTNHNGRLDGNDSTFVCSGAMIGRHYVLTAAHCLYDSENGGFAKKIEVRPGRTPSSAPFGVATGTRITVPTAWTQNNFLSDIGVIKLDRDIGAQTGWYGYKVASTAELQNTTLNMRHYPASPKSNGRQQFYSSGRASLVGPNVIYYRHDTISTFGGSSGAPVYFSATRQIVGVHVRGSLGRDGANEATRLTLPFFNFIQYFRKTNQSAAQAGSSGPVGELYDLQTGTFSGPTAVAAHFQLTEASAEGAAQLAVEVVPTSTATSTQSSLKTSAASTVSSPGQFSEAADFRSKKEPAADDLKPVNKSAADALFSADADELFAEPSLALL